MILGCNSKDIGMLAEFYKGNTIRSFANPIGNGCYRKPGKAAHLAHTVTRYLHATEITALGAMPLSLFARQATPLPRRHPHLVGKYTPEGSHGLISDRLGHGLGSPPGFLQLIGGQAYTDIS